MAQSNTDKPTQKKLDANSLLTLFQKFFIVPENKEELMGIGGLTGRQKDAMVLLADGYGIEEITKMLAPEGGGSSKDGKKVYTFNIYDALNGGIGKYVKAMCLMMSLTLDYDKTLVGAIFDRAILVHKKKTGVDRFVLPMVEKKKILEE